MAMNELQQPQNGNRIHQHIAPVPGSQTETEDGEPSTRACRECGKEKALDSFALGRGERVSSEMAYDICRPCRRRIMQHVNHHDERQKQQEKFERQVSKLVRQLNGDTLANAPHIVEQLDSFFGKIGGLSTFTDNMKAVHELVMAEGNIAQKQRQIKEITQLIQASTELRESAPDMTGMSDEQVSKLMVHGMMEHLQKIGGRIVFDNDPPPPRIEHHPEAPEPADHAHAHDTGYTPQE